MAIRKHYSRTLLSLVPYVPSYVLYNCVKFADCHLVTLVVLHCLPVTVGTYKPGTRVILELESCKLQACERENSGEFPVVPPTGDR
jgi:hypothetical protein